MPMLRLTDLHLESCTGCLRCVIGGKPCRLDDDMAWLVDAIQEADGLVLAAPTYFLGPAAVIKLVLDRLLMVPGHVDDALPPLRAGHHHRHCRLGGWRGVTLPYLNALVAAFGYQPIDSLTAIAPGPGEVLLDEDLMDRVLSWQASAWAAANWSPPRRRPTSVPSATAIPSCSTATVPPAPSAAGRPPSSSMGMGCSSALTRQPAHDHRWTPEGLRKHMVDWVMATGPRFMASRSEIKARRQPYRQMDVDWLCPPRIDEDTAEGHDDHGRLAIHWTPLSEQPARPLSDWPAHYPDHRPMGYLCSYVPEEMHPRGGLCTRTVAGHQRPAAPGRCPPAILHLRPVPQHPGPGLGRQLDVLAGTVFAHTCDAMQALADLWRMNTERSHFVDTVMQPANLGSQAAHAYLVAELERFRDELADFAGRPSPTRD